MPKKQGSRNYSHREQLCLVMEVSQVLPLDQDGWAIVTTRFNARLSQYHHFRSVASLKRKFAGLWRACEHRDEDRLSTSQKLAREAKRRIDERLAQRPEHCDRSIDGAGRPTPGPIDSVDMTRAGERADDGSFQRGFKGRLAQVPRLHPAPEGRLSTGGLSGENENGRDSENELCYADAGQVGECEIAPCCQCGERYRLLIQQLDKLQEAVIQKVEEVYGVERSERLHMRKIDLRTTRKYGKQLKEWVLSLKATPQD